MNRLLGILEEGPADCPCVFNPWRDADERDRSPRRAAPAIRRENLRAYLEDRRKSARVILMGEAPSHRGCRFSGIPFCSEVELTTKAGLVARRTLELTSRDATTKPQRERSAFVVWRELERHDCAYQVILWNAFPWHPYLSPALEAKGERCGPATNRRPRTAEVEQGHAAFAALQRAFARPLEVFAVGRVAEAALALWPDARAAGCLRHPAQGGETLFRDHFQKLVLPRLE